MIEIPIPRVPVRFDDRPLALSEEERLHLLRLCTKHLLDLAAKGDFDRHAAKLSGQCVEKLARSFADQDRGTTNS